MSKILHENHTKLVIDAAEKNWERNKAKMQAKGIDKTSYMLGYLHGYEACYETYDIDQVGDIIKQYGKKGDPQQ